jgi:hypothetical protein
MNFNPSTNLENWIKLKDLLNFFLHKTECADFAHPVDYVSHFHC